MRSTPSSRGGFCPGAMSDTPLYDALKKRADHRTVRLHMPGHKGKALDNLPLLDSELDFTELSDTGNLYEGVPPISDAEALFADAYGAAHAFFLTGGASQGVRAAVYTACRPGGSLICDRNCHTSVHAALVMKDIQCEYIETKEVDGFGVTGRIVPEALDAAIRRTPDAGAVFITSPTYYGVLQDITALADVSHRHGLPLIVDEAHGAHLPFLEGYSGAIAHGADIAVASLHKTLPVLGQSALLSASGRFDQSVIRSACALFGSSSPSYLMMANMDLARSYMQREGAGRQSAVAAEIRRLTAVLMERGLDVLGCHIPCDPLRLTVSTASVGLSGRDAYARLERDGIAAEFADSDNLVFILSVFDEKKDIEKLESALIALTEEQRPPLAVTQSVIPKAEHARRPREAALSPETALPLSRCAGAVASRPITIFPPGIQLIGAGEKISEEHIAFLTARGENKNRKIYTVQINDTEE